jgi:hypothetical protein
VRGFSKVRRLVLDEAQILTEAALADMAPTMNQAHDPQIIMMGTPPKPNDPSEVFAGMRARALAGDLEGALFVEVGADPGSDPDDRATWARANPSYPHRTPERAILRLRKLLDDDDFLREALGIWDTAAQQQVVHPDVWHSLVDGRSEPRLPVCFSADVTPDRQRGSIALAGERADGRTHVEVVNNDAGTGWMVSRLVELNAKWRPVGIVVDPGSPAGSLIPLLQAQGVEPVLTSARDVGQACGSFYDLATTDGLRHLDDPRLNLALGAARKRPIGDSGAWGWHRRDSTTDITPLVAVTLAMWGFASRRPEPKVRRAFGRAKSY